MASSSTGFISPTSFSPQVRSCILVEYNNCKKEIQYHDEEDLKSKLIESFKLQEGVLIEKWNDRWNEWVDLESFAEIEDGMRVKLRRDPEEMLPLSVSQLPLNDSIGSSSSFNDSSFNDSITSGAPPSLEDSGSESNTATSSTAIGQQAAFKSKPWPSPFLLDESFFQKKMVDRYNNGGSYDESDRSRILSGVYDNVTVYVLYPTPRQYKDMSTALLTKWPQLAGDLNVNIAMDTWRLKLSTKFRNQRCRDKLQYDEVIAKKHKSKYQQVTTGKRLNVWGVPNYSPDRYDGEDDESQETHLSTIRKEGRVIPTQRSKPRIKFAMDRTFPDRRGAIIGGCTLTELGEKYSLLFEEEQIFLEFTRITEIDLQKRMIEGLEKISKKICSFNKVKNEADEVPFWRVKASECRDADLKS